MTAVKLVARAIARANGDSYDHIHRDKAHWTKTSGILKGVPRDFNSPFQSDYDEMAEAAITTLRSLDGG